MYFDVLLKLLYLFLGISFNDLRRRLVFHFFFELLLFRWYYSTGFSLQTVDAVSTRRQISCNPLTIIITGVIRDVMFTFRAYTVSIHRLWITTMFSNLHIFRRGTRRAVAIARICSDDGISHTITSPITLTRISTNSTIFYLEACAATLTRKTIDGNIWYRLARIFTVTRVSTDIYVVCAKTSIFSLCKRGETARRRRHYLWDDNTNNLHANNNNNN